MARSEEGAFAAAAVRPSGLAAYAAACACALAAALAAAASAAFALAAGSLAKASKKAHVAAHTDSCAFFVSSPSPCFLAGAPPPPCLRNVPRA